MEVMTYSSLVEVIKLHRVEDQSAVGTEVEAEARGRVA
jgi:hypothetical protein